jgi:hypothetical protein
MKLLIVLSLLIYSVYAIVLQPPPSPTAPSTAIAKRSQGTPTHAPQRYVKRDIDDTLSLYEYWASECTGDSDNNADIALSDINNLWQTVTNTVYCGNNNVKTITKTITKTSTTTTKNSGGSGSKGGGSKTSCDDKCWSTYLWRKFFCIIITA